MLFRSPLFGKILFIFILGFALNLTIHTEAKAASTSITGSISNLPAEYWGLSFAEKKVGANWVTMWSSISKFGSDTSTFSASMIEASVGDIVRVWIQISNQGNTYFLGGEELTVSNSNQSYDLTVPSPNIKLSISGDSQKLACESAWIQVTSEDFDERDKIKPSGSFSDGILNFY